MSNTFLITLGQMGVLILFFAIGYLLCKFVKGLDALGSVIAKLELYVFLPATCYNIFAKNLTVASLSSRMPCLLAGLILIAAAMLVAYPISRKLGQTRADRAMYFYAYTIPNIGYFGIPLVGAVFGEEALCNYMIFSLPFNVFIYTVGVRIMNPNPAPFTLKSLLNPTLISLLIGAIAGLTGFTLPGFLAQTIASSNACLAPLAMIMTGFVLAKMPIKQVLSGISVYIQSAVKLLVYPLLLMAILRALSVDKEVVRVAAAMFAMPFGLNIVVFPEAYGGNSKEGARLCFVSHLAAGISVPIVFSLLATL